MGIGAGAVGRRAENPETGALEEERLGGARADFAASLGRRVAELAGLLTRIEEGPRSIRFSGDLRRRLLALSAGARLLRFTRLAEALSEVESAVDGAAVRGIIPEHEAAAIRAMVERLPALAWSRAPVSSTARQGGPVKETEAPRAAAPALDLDLDWQPAEPSESASVSASESESASVSVPASVSASVSVSAPATELSTSDEPAAVPMIALVVGPPAMAEALRFAEAGPGFEVERIDDAPIAIDLARSIAPDVVLIDADRDGARELVEALVADPLTQEVPILVAGSWSRPEEAGVFAALGASRALAKPISPDALRRACAEVATTFEKREPRREPLGELSIAELGEKLAEELRRGLSEAAVPQAQGAKVDFGEGSDVLAALWGAVARVRDIATIRSQGLIRFTSSGPEGALPFAPWLGEREGEARQSRVRFAAGEARGSSAMRLDGVVAVVADDDAAVTWFLADVLRAAGATVHTAVDGARALDLAYQVGPDLVISDVLMPEVDGFRLSRALKRDVALRDVPVILLSWKEDLLQRVRELGAPADGYLRKQASAATIVQRVREVMAPRSRVLGRLAAGGEVKGRLDGLTTRTLLAMVCSKRPSSTLSVWDASHLYEVEIRDGRPVRATRTTVDGSFERGPGVLAALLGVGAGRFAVSAALPAEARPASFRADLVGSLSEQLTPVIASARAAQRLLSGEALVEVERVALDAERLAGVTAAMPEPVRALLRRIAGGASPRGLIHTGQTSARFLEDVLCDAAARGAVRGIFDPELRDVLPAAIEREASTLRGERRPEPPPIEIPILGLEDAAPTAAPGAAAPVAPAPGLPIDFIEVSIDIEASPEAPPAAPKAAANQAAPATTATEAAPPRPSPGPVMTLGSLSPPPVHSAEPDPSGLPPGFDETSAAPRATPVSGSKTRPTSARSKSVRPEPRPSDDMTPDASRMRRPSYYAPPAEAPVKTEPTRSSRAGMWALFAAAGIVFAVGARMSRERELAAQAPPQAPQPIATAAPPPPAEAAPPPVAAIAPAVAVQKPVGESAENPILPQDLPLRPDDKVPAGQGMLEVVAGVSDAIHVDNRLIGNGPIVKLPLGPRPEPYEIRIKLRGEERVRFALVREGRLTRVRVAPPWSR
jgi:CheY-like chemotaxis protein